MSRATYKFDESGKLIQVSGETQESKSAFVHEDTISPLRNLVTGKYYNSKSKYIKDCKALGLQIVGNDLLSKQKDQRKENITETKVLNAIEKAESICNDPYKLNQHRNRNLMLMERNERLLKWQ